MAIQFISSISNLMLNRNVRAVMFVLGEITIIIFRKRKRMVIRKLSVIICSYHVLKQCYFGHGDSSMRRKYNVLKINTGSFSDLSIKENTLISKVF